MPNIAVFGGTGYLAKIIKNQKKLKKNQYTFFSRNKSSKNYINYLLFKKNLNILKKFDVIIHLAGPNQNQLKRNINLLNKKNKITSNICDLCLAHNIKLIYLSSMQVYKDYGKNNIYIKSKINKNNPYSLSHYASEQIILNKFLNQKKMFTILRMGNVFGLKKNIDLDEINYNLVHSLCILAIKKKKIFIKNPSIQRTFVPSPIFIKVINFIINKNFFNNSIINISYKNLSLKDIALIIQKRLKLIYNICIDTSSKGLSYEKKFLIYSNRNFRFIPSNKKIYLEIDNILKLIIKKIKVKINT